MYFPIATKVSFFYGIAKWTLGKTFIIVDTIKSDTLLVNIENDVNNIANYFYRYPYVIFILWSSSKEINLKIIYKRDSFNVKVRFEDGVPNNYVSYILDIPLKYQNTDIIVNKDEIITSYRKINKYKVDDYGNIILPFEN